MHGVLPVVPAIAREAAPAFGSDLLPDAGAIPGSESEWFYDAVLAVCGRKDPGYQLHLFTGWPLSSCRAFCAKDAGQRRKPNTEFLGLLFRSDHGEPFWRAFMHGSTARWYADLCALERRACAAEARLAVIVEITKRD